MPGLVATSRSLEARTFPGDPIGGNRDDEAPLDHENRAHGFCGTAVLRSRCAMVDAPHDHRLKESGR